MKNKGFTLIEILVVLGIIGLLTSIGGAAVNSARTKARITKARSDVETIYKAIEMLANDTQEWPSHQAVDQAGEAGNNEVCGDGCGYGISDDEAGLISTDGLYNDWEGPYIQYIPLDPWGNEYFFDNDYYINDKSEPCNGEGGCALVAVVGSYGPDGQGNNQYNDDDVITIITR